jgi:hypothetical protein
MPPRFLLVLLGIAGLTAACAHTNVQDCQTTDWFHLGQRDGLVGAPHDVFKKYQDVCRELGIEPDRVAYQNGHREGLQFYCTDQNGFRTGRNRRAYHYVCPPELEKTFLRGRARGLRLSGCRAEIYVFDEHMASLNQALERLERQLTDPSLSTPAKERLRQQIEALETLYQQTAAEQNDVDIHCLEGL